MFPSSSIRPRTDRRFLEAMERLPASMVSCYMTIPSTFWRWPSLITPSTASRPSTTFGIYKYCLVRMNFLFDGTRMSKACRFYGMRVWPVALPKSPSRRLRSTKFSRRYSGFRGISVMLQYMRYAVILGRNSIVSNFIEY